MKRLAVALALLCVAVGAWQAWEAMGEHETAPAHEVEVVEAPATPEPRSALQYERAAPEAVAPPPVAAPPPPAEPFRPSPSGQDFATPAPAGHSPAAQRDLAARFEAWTRGPENADAGVQFVGVDCRQPPCVVSLQWNQDRGGAFGLRAREWLAKNGGVGAPLAFTHRLDANQVREWFYFSPHAPGSAAHHAYEKAATAAIIAEVETLPSHNPSAELIEGRKLPSLSSGAHRARSLRGFAPLPGAQKRIPGDPGPRP